MLAIRTPWIHISYFYFAYQDNIYFLTIKSKNKKQKHNPNKSQFFKINNN